MVGGVAISAGNNDTFVDLEEIQKIYPPIGSTRLPVQKVSGFMRENWCGRRDSNPGRRLFPRPDSWGADVLDQARLRPLYKDRRSTSHIANGSEPREVETLGVS